MPTYSNYRPRLSIEITEESRNKLQKLLPHGTQKLVFQLIVDDLISLMEKHGSGKIIGMFIERHAKLEDLLRMKL